jgi:hypothetical protein
VRDDPKEVDTSQKSVTSVTSVTKEARLIKSMNQSAKVISLTCDHEEVPYYMKIHKLNCPNHTKPKDKYNCPVCKKNHKPTFKTDIKEQYDDHMRSKHRRMSDVVP